MTAKGYLSQVENLDKKIKTKLCELHELGSLATCVTAVIISEKVQSTKQNSANKIMDKIIDLQNEINAEIDFLVDYKSEVREKINKLNNELQKEILINRYINCYSFEKCAEVMGYSLRNTYRIHKKAIMSLNVIVNL